MTAAPDPTPAPPRDAARKRIIGAAGVALAAAIALWAPFPADQPLLAPMAAVAALMAVWWIFEVVPIAVTSLLPIVLFPLLGLTELKTVTASYAKPTVFLFLGGFILALGLERSGLHRRIALAIVGAIGSRPSALVGGFMLATAVLSMWISNTASVMVMMPIGMSVLREAAAGPRADIVTGLGTALMLGIAYAADIGGMATPVGTPPNLALIEIQQSVFPDAPAIGFGAWMAMGLPLFVVFMGCGWVLLTQVLYRLGSAPVFGERGAITQARAALGPLRRDEVVAGAVFFTTALLWMTGSPMRFGELEFAGWRAALELPQVGDGAVAVAAGVLLFLVPSGDRRGESLMTWEAARHGVPWGILLLFGGGFALAAGFEASGLSKHIGDGLTGLADTDPVLVVIIVCVGLTLLTELTSNTATANLLLPILARAAPALGLDPRTLMVPATLSASCAFMMPVASPTQAIVFGSGYVPMRQMVRAGIWFNLLGVALVTLVWFLIGEAVFDVGDGVPDWARAPAAATP